MPKMVKKLIVVLLLTTLYTIVRYVIFGQVSLNHMPVYLLNKSVSMSSVFFLFFTAVNHNKNRTEKIEFWNTAFLHSVFIHILLSLAILSNAYYPKFFGTEKMNLTGELTILFGISAIYFIRITHKNKSVLKRAQTFRLLSVLFVAGHLITMGSEGWIKIEKWHGGLPPISQISFIFSAISLALFLRAKLRD